MPDMNQTTHLDKTANGIAKSLSDNLTTDRISDVARQGADMARQGYETVRDSVASAGRSTMNFARRNPYWAAFGAIAIGALAYWLATRNSESEYA